MQGGVLDVDMMATHYSASEPSRGHRHKAGHIPQPNLVPTLSYELHARQRASVDGLDACPNDLTANRQAHAAG